MGVAFLDCETEANRYRANPAVVVCLDSRELGGGFDMLHHTAARPYIEWLLASDTIICAHSANADMMFLGARYPDLIPAIFAKYDRLQITCTEIREKLIDIFEARRDDPHIEHAYGLDDVQRRRAPHVKTPNKSSEWRLRFGEFEHVPDVRTWPPEAREYLAGDVEVLPAIYHAQEAKYGAILGNQWQQARDAFALAITGARGLRTDPEKVAKLRRVIGTQHAHIAAYLKREGLLKPKFKRQPDGIQSRDTKRAKAIMLEVHAARGTNPTRNEPTKKMLEQGISVGDLCLDATECELSGDPRLQAYGRYTSLNSVLTSTIPLLEQGEVFSWFDTLLSTGRTSTSPNTQNMKVKVYGSGICKCGAWEQDHLEGSLDLPPAKRKHNICLASLFPEGVRGKDGKYEPTETAGVRECLMPRPGYVYAIADFGGLELATWAQTCLDWFGFSDMAETLRAGRDAHLVMAAQILGESYEQCDAGYHAEQETKKLGRYYQARQTAKVGNFGCPGGLGKTSLVAYAFSNYGVTLSIDEAKALIDAWRTAYREARPYLERVAQIARQPEAKIVQVRSNRIRGLSKDRAYTQGGNTMFQGLGSDLAKDAHYHVTRECFCCPASALYGSRPCMFVHDESVVEAPEDRAAEACERLSAVMVERARIWIPDVPIKAEPVITRTYTKAAKTRRDTSGRLIEWVP